MRRKRSLRRRECPQAGAELGLRVQPGGALSPFLCRVMEGGLWMIADMQGR